jgi:ribulose-5-phosphate 4-epimerase/fuculose-1-phosphate aldolase
MKDIISEKQIDEFIMAAHGVARHGLVLCGSGNLSMRADGDHMLVTESGAWMSDMTKDQVAICRIEDGVCVNQKTPSVEIGFHKAVLKTRRDINLVLHFQSPYATTLACREMNWEHNLFLIPEGPYYIGPVAVIPYMPPGSEGLAKAVATAMEFHDMAVLKNHGQVTVGKDYKKMLERAVFFELASFVYYRAGKDARFLEKDAVDSLFQARRERTNTNGKKDRSGNPFI